MRASRQTDGRARRSERTRAVIVRAHVGLLRDGTLKPSAQVIADAAGVSVRTLWVSFGDMESLFRETVAYWLDSDDGLRSPIDPGLSLDARIEQFCASRVRRLVNIAPAARAVQLLTGSSPTLRESRRTYIERVAAEIAEVFAGELAAADDPDVLRDAVLAAVSWNAWAVLHDDLGRSVEDCEAAMTRSVRALLGAPGPARD